MSTQPLTSRVIERATPAAQPFTFPGIFRSKESGSLWIANFRGYAIRLSLPHPSDGRTGARIQETRARGGEINEAEYVQITGPVTIEFNPTPSYFI